MAIVFARLHLLHHLYYKCGIIPAWYLVVKFNEWKCRQHKQKCNKYSITHPFVWACSCFKYFPSYNLAAGSKRQEDVMNMWCASVLLLLDTFFAKNNKKKITKKNTGALFCLNWLNEGGKNITFRKIWFFFFSLLLFSWFFSHLLICIFFWSGASFNKKPELTKKLKLDRA